MSGTALPFRVSKPSILKKTHIKITQKNEIAPLRKQPLLTYYILKSFCNNPPYLCETVDLASSPVLTGLRAADTASAI